MVTALKGRLRAHSSHLNRTVYCLVSLPQDHTRDDCIGILHQVSKEIPKIVFVELQESVDEREEAVATYIAIRYADSK